MGDKKYAEVKVLLVTHRRNYCFCGIFSFLAEIALADSVD